MNTSTIETEASTVNSIEALPSLRVPNQGWKSLVKFIPNPKEMEASRLPGAHGMIHYRDGVVTVATGHCALQIEPAIEMESVAGGFLIDPKASLGVNKLITPARKLSTAGYAALAPYFTEFDSAAHHVRLTVDAKLLKRFCEAAIAITRMGHMTLTIHNPATHPMGDREDVINPVLITFDNEQDESHQTRGLLATIQRRGREFTESPRRGLPLLSNATKQQLQMELLRRVVQPAIGLDGGVVAATLEDYPHLWHHVEVPQVCWLNLLSPDPQFQSFTLKIAYHALAVNADKLLDLMQSWGHGLYCDLDDDRRYICVKWGNDDG